MVRKLLDMGKVQGDYLPFLIMITCILLPQPVNWLLALSVIVVPGLLKNHPAAELALEVEALKKILAKK
jgi:hypothetical protein